MMNREGHAKGFVGASELTTPSRRFCSESNGVKLDNTAETRVFCVYHNILEAIAQ